MHTTSNIDSLHANARETGLFVSLMQPNQTFITALQPLPSLLTSSPFTSPPAPFLSPHFQSLSKASLPFQAPPPKFIFRLSFKCISNLTPISTSSLRRSFQDPIYYQLLLPVRTDALGLSFVLLAPHLTGPLWTHDSQQVREAAVWSLPRVLE